MIRINCILKTDALRRSSLVETALALVEHSRKEEGCVAYDLFVASDNNMHLMIFETWSSLQALEQHQATTFFKEYAPRLRQFAEVESTRFEY